MRTRALGLTIAALFVLLAAGALALSQLRPQQGYRLALAHWIAPRTTEVEIDDIIQRKADFIVDYYGFKYRGYTGNFIDAHVYYYGAFEKPEIYFIRDTLRALPPGSVFIDVGANTGLYSVFASKHAATVHAFEPFPPILVRLNTVIEENNVSNVIVHPVGLGAADSEMPFFSPPDGNQGSGSFLAGFKQFQPGNRDDHLKLRIVTGDGYLATANVSRVDFIKMDIEGYEKAAIAGLRETLKHRRPIVVMETSVDPAVDGLFKNMDDIRAAFPENYEFFQVDSVNNVTGAYAVRTIRSTFTRQDQFNLVALPQEKASLVPRRSQGDPAPSRQ